MLIQTRGFCRKRFLLRDLFDGKIHQNYLNFKDIKSTNCCLLEGNCVDLHVYLTIHNYLQYKSYIHFKFFFHLKRVVNQRKVIVVQNL